MRPAAVRAYPPLCLRHLPPKGFCAKCGIGAKSAVAPYLVGGRGFSEIRHFAQNSQGGRKLEPDGISPQGEKIPSGGVAMRENFLPPLCGERCRSATEGGRPRAESRYAPPPAPRPHPPLCLAASPPQGGEKIPEPWRRNARKFSPPAVRGEMSQRDRGGACGRRRVVHTSGGAAAYPPSASGISPSRGEKFPERGRRNARKFSPPACGGRCRGATEGGRRAREGGTYLRWWCGRTPPLPTASPPQGGEKIPSLRHLSPWGERLGDCGIRLSRLEGRRLEVSPPACGGRCRGATEGGRRAQEGGTYLRRRCGRTPLCLRHLPPQGGEKIPSGGSRLGGGISSLFGEPED